MHKGKYVFSQLLDFLERNDFNYLARKYRGDKYVKQFLLQAALRADVRPAFQSRKSP